MGSNVHVLVANCSQVWTHARPLIGQLLLVLVSDWPRASHHPRLSTHSDANHKTNILRGGVPTISVIPSVIIAFCSAIWNGFVEGLYMALKIIIPNQITLSQLPAGQYFLLQVLNQNRFWKLFSPSVTPVIRTRKNTANCEPFCCNKTFKNCKLTLNYSF